MIEFIFIDFDGKKHTISASEVSAAFQYADENFRQGISLKYYWIEVSPLTYKLGVRK
jgi:hypothetical protein